MFPDPAAGMTGKVDADAARQGFCPVQISDFAGRLERGDHGFRHMHVGVLAAIGRKRAPVARHLVGVEAMLITPEALLEQIPGFRDPLPHAGDAGLHRGRIGEQHEGVAVGVLVGVGRTAAFDYPEVAAVLGVAMDLVEMLQAMFGGLQELGTVEQACGQREVEDEPRRRDDVLRLAVGDEAVVPEEVEVAAIALVDAGWMVEVHYLAHVAKQEIPRAKVGQVVHSRAPALLKGNFANRASPPSSSSIRSTSFHLAMRSERENEPTLSCPASQPTARCAIVVSSLSPERADTIVPKPAFLPASQRFPASLSPAGLVRLDQNRVDRPVRRGLLHTGGVRNQEIVADDLTASAVLRREGSKSCGVILRQRILD